MMALTLLFALLLLGLFVGLFFYAAISPVQLIERWFACVLNREKLPERPSLGFKIWLTPIYQELQAVEKRLEEIDRRTALIEEQREQAEFIYNCVFTSLLEGVLVVDNQRRVKLVNSEFMNIFHLVQSPLKAGLDSVFPGHRIVELVDLAFESKQVQSDVIRHKYDVDMLGRPPNYEVRAAPIFLGNTVVSVIVLFLPPANRLRMIQTLKWHSRKLNNLVNHLLVSSQTIHRLPEMESEDIDPTTLLTELRNSFLGRPDNKNATLSLSIDKNIPAFRADRSQLLSALLQLLENTLFYADDKAKILLSATAGEEGVRITIEVEGAIFPAQEIALLSATESDVAPEDEDHLPDYSSGFLSIRETLEAQAGNFSMTTERKNKHVAFAINFQSNPKAVIPPLVGVDFEDN